MSPPIVQRLAAAMPRQGCLLEPLAKRGMFGPASGAPGGAVAQATVSPGCQAVFIGRSKADVDAKASEEQRERHIPPSPVSLRGRRMELEDAARTARVWSSMGALTGCEPNGRRRRCRHCQSLQQLWRLAIYTYFGGNYQYCCITHCKQGVSPFKYQTI